MRIFILEDDESRISLFADAVYADHDVDIARSTAEAKEKWNPPYDIICLDHDLGGMQMVDSDNEDTGYQFAVFMGECPGNTDTRVWIHSYNITGALHMEMLLSQNGWQAHRQPFGLKLLDYLKGLE